MNQGSEVSLRTSSEKGSSTGTTTSPARHPKERRPDLPRSDDGDSDFGFVITITSLLANVLTLWAQLFYLWLLIIWLFNYLCCLWGLEVISQMK